MTLVFRTTLNGRVMAIAWHDGLGGRPLGWHNWESHRTYPTVADAAVALQQHDYIARLTTRADRDSYAARNLAAAANVEAPDIHVFFAKLEDTANA